MPVPGNRLVPMLHYYYAAKKKHQPLALEMLKKRTCSGLEGIGGREMGWKMLFSMARYKYDCGDEW